MMKKIYVAEYKGMYKIGVSVNTERRMKQLSCGCPGIVCIYESPFLDKFYQVEHKLHNIFKSYCIGGEWFSKVDFQIIENTVRIEGSASKSMKSDMNMTEFNLETFAGGTFSINTLKKEEKQLKHENEQLEKFLFAVNGADIPNVYSDLIYEILFGKNTEQLVANYKPSKYESFRNHLSDEQKTKIEALTKVIVGLIGFEWKFEEIKDFVLGL